MIVESQNLLRILVDYLQSENYLYMYNASLPAQQMRVIPHALGAKREKLIITGHAISGAIQNTEKIEKV